MRRAIVPKTPGQRTYLEVIHAHDIVIGIGPAGTGKTYLAVAKAVEALARKQVRRIILARPAVEAGESLGLLPGGWQEEGDPYLSCDVAAAKVMKQLRRYKSRLRDHHERIEKLPAEDILHVRDAVIGDEHFDGNGVPQGKDPVIVAEMTATILTLSVSDAVMRMDLAGQPALLFRNGSNGELNMVYRR